MEKKNFIPMNLAPKKTKDSNCIKLDIGIIDEEINLNEPINIKLNINITPKKDNTPEIEIL